MKTAHLCISSGGMEESYGVGSSTWTPMRFVKGYPLRAHPRGDKACDQRKNARGRRRNKEDNKPDRANSKYSKVKQMGTHSSIVAAKCLRDISLYREKKCETENVIV
jgi:hypothetical protein